MVFSHPLEELLGRDPNAGPRPTTAPQGPPATPAPDAGQPGRPPASPMGTQGGGAPSTGGGNSLPAGMPQVPTVPIGGGGNPSPAPKPPAPAPPSQPTPAPTPAPAPQAPPAPPPPGAGYNNMPKGWIGPPEPDMVAPRGTDAWRDAVKVRRDFIAQYLAQGGELNDVVDKYNEQGQLSSDWKLWSGDQWLPERESYNAGLAHFRDYVSRGLIKQDPATGLFYNPPPGIVSWQDQFGNHVPDPYAGTGGGPYGRGGGAPAPGPLTAPGGTQPYVNPLLALIAPNGQLPSHIGPATQALINSIPGGMSSLSAGLSVPAAQPPAAAPTNAPPPAAAQPPAQTVPAPGTNPAPAAPPATPMSPQPVAPGASSPGSYSPGQAPAPGAPAGGPAPVPGQPPVITMPRVPTDAEAAMLPPGVTVETPVGTWRAQGADGKPEVVLNAAGQEAYRQKVAETMTKFNGAPMGNDPLAPQPDILPGKRNFNPFAAGDGWVS